MSRGFTNYGEQRTLFVFCDTAVFRAGDTVRDFVRTGTAAVGTVTQTGELPDLWEVNPQGQGILDTAALDQRYNCQGQGQPSTDIPWRWVSGIGEPELRTDGDGNVYTEKIPIFFSTHCGPANDQFPDTYRWGYTFYWPNRGDNGTFEGGTDVFWLSGAQTVLPTAYGLGTPIVAGDFTYFTSTLGALPDPPGAAPDPDGERRLGMVRVRNADLADRADYRWWDPQNNCWCVDQNNVAGAGPVSVDGVALQGVADGHVFSNITLERHTNLAGGTRVMMLVSEANIGGGADGGVGWLQLAETTTIGNPNSWSWHRDGKRERLGLDGDGDPTRCIAILSCYALYLHPEISDPDEFMVSYYHKPVDGSFSKLNHLRLARVHYRD